MENKKNEINNIIQKYLVLSMLIIIASAIIAMLIKVSVGLMPWDAINLTLSYITNIKVGTITIYLGMILVVSQIVMLGKNYKKRNLIQIPLVFLMGYGINFFNYIVFKNVAYNNYILALFVYIFCVVLFAVIIGAIVALNLVILPVEGICVAVSEKFNIKFTFVRQMLDLLSLILSVMGTLFLGVPWTVREGTVITMFINAPIMHIVIPKIEKLYKKYNLI